MTTALTVFFIYCSFSFTETKSVFSAYLLCTHNVQLANLWHKQQQQTNTGQWKDMLVLIKNAQLCYNDSGLHHCLYTSEGHKYDWKGFGVE